GRPTPSDSGRAAVDRSGRDQPAGDSRGMDQHLNPIDLIQRDRSLSLNKLFPAVIITTVLALQVTPPAGAQTAAPAQSEPQVSHPAVHSHRLTVRDAALATPAFCASCVRDNLTYLSGPAMRGRGSGTEDEHHA